MRVGQKIYLNQNERHTPLPAVILAEIQAAWTRLELHRYDEDITAALKADLAATYDLPADDIFITAGGDGGIEIITTAAARTVQQAIIPVPNFVVYHWACAKAQLPIRTVPIDLEQGSLPLKAVAAAADRPSLFFLCRPHNPTGDVPGVAQVDELARLLPKGSVILIDEAYLEYGADSLAGWLTGRTDATLIRTFSKALGLAGLRCGYAVIPSPWREPALAVTPPFAVANTAQAAARVVLRHLPELAAEAADVARRRQRLFEQMQAVPGIKPFPGAGNYVLFRVNAGPAAARTLAAQLAARKIFIRAYGNDPRISDCLRVSIGTEAEVGAFYDALADLTATAVIQKEV